MGCTVKCSPLNWPTMAHILAESFSKLNQRVVVTTRSQIKKNPCFKFSQDLIPRVTKITIQKKRPIKNYLLGMINCSKAQSSFREFCSGVPVIRILWLVVNSMRALYRRASSFFSLWASSTTKQHQLIVPNVCWVRIIRVSFDCFINFRAQIETKQTNKQTHKQTIINNKFILWFILDSYSSVMKFRTTFFTHPVFQ